ncbi:MAG: sugar ABC transporter permease [Anaerolineales bacterium]|nr:MAG: sugar ABC transporter permease [Anaerolineales bacterium]
MIRVKETSNDAHEIKREGHGPGKRYRWDELISAYLFLSPSIIVFSLFTYFSLLYAFYLSLHRWRLGIVARTFVGLHNYCVLITSAEFWAVVRNSFYYTLGSIPLNMAIALAIALLLNHQIRGMAIFRTAYFLPTITSTAAMAVVWLWIYHPDFGLANWVLDLIGLPRLRWLSDPHWSMPALIIMGIWKGVGYNIIIYLAGLQNIPQHLYEAARIDGADSWACFRHITWPLLTPISFFILIIAVINSLKAFAQMHVMTEGGPLGSTTVIAYYLYQHGFQFFNLGYASAVACVLFVILLALTLVQFKFLSPRVHYR